MIHPYISEATTLAIIAGVIISLFYLRYMWLALRRVAHTISYPDSGEPDRFAFSFVGAILAVAASSLAIISYGFTPNFLWVGVGLALLSPIAVAYTLYREFHDRS